jgi:hypothetical protein
MFWLVGERLNVPRLDPETEAHFEARWIEDPVREMVRFPAFPPSSVCRARLHKWYQVNLEIRESWSVVNLLWPCRCVGAWDAEWAREGAQLLGTRLGKNNGSAILLGRRVAEAFDLEGLEFGETGEGFGCRCLVLPHPSGRNRWLSWPGNRGRLPLWIRRFVGSEWERVYKRVRGELREGMLEQLEAVAKEYGLNVDDLRLGFKNAAAGADFEEGLRE